MLPKFMMVVSPDCDWGVLYWVSNVSDHKIWEGHEYTSNALGAMAECMGYGIENYEFTDEDEIDGCTPDTFGSIKGIKKFAETT